MDFSIWLIPENNQKIFFQKIINQLAKKYSSFPFTPHITLYHFEKNIKEEKIIDLLQKDFINQKKLILEFEDINYSEIFTKTLYCQLKFNNQLKKLYQKAKKIFSKLSSYHLNPHLSLIYKNQMKEEDKIKEKTKLLSIIPKQIIFDKLALITREKGSIKNEEDVLEWREKLTIDLV